ncbi:unnamed protein product, partial [Adineta ricciae]
MAISSLGQSTSYYQAIGQAKVAAASVWDVICLEKSTTTAVDSEEKTLNVDFRGTVKVDNVFFSYPSRPDVSVLRGLSFEARPGQIVALVGASGCGKSTCVQILQQFYRPTKGRILFDDEPIENFNLQALRQQIGVVNQEPTLFATTIFRNIQYGQPSATLDDIQAAAMAANAHDFIMSLPEKYETVVGERGIQLSGGERQRIVIARALV